MEGAIATSSKIVVLETTTTIKEIIVALVTTMEEVVIWVTRIIPTNIINVKFVGNSNTLSSVARNGSTRITLVLRN
jgi:hypothetical protein